jgi:hypothetical protein
MDVTVVPAVIAAARERYAAGGCGRAFRVERVSQGFVAGNAGDAAGSSKSPR